MTEKTTDTYALITGASQGLGKYFAIELAERKYHTILVALPGENIDHVADMCRINGRKSVIYETDLTNKQNILELTKWVNDHFELSILVNNAGLGGTRSFVDSDVDYIDNIIQLNITALALITHQLLPNLLKQRHGYILNVSSMASFSPIGYKTVYPASKKFVQSFTLGLNQELKNSNVFASVVHPGPMKTNQSVTQRIENQGWIGRLGLMSPEMVAKKTIYNLLKKKPLILLGWSNRINWLLLVLTPRNIKLPLLTRAVKREIVATKKPIK
ncbi:SDR family NAD(P)-dependent oxidoreductase [Natronoflexus pectinivorans]|nr:SDR family NAD(P)-dependent oxidoreductase [Natronoflexus pectinivorans]